jgi:hypothetical protein
VAAAIIISCMTAVAPCHSYQQDNMNTPLSFIIVCSADVSKSEQATTPHCQKAVRRVVAVLLLLTVLGAARPQMRCAHICILQPEQAAR